MIGNKLEQSIISMFQYAPTSTFSINELSKKLGKAYPYINKKVNFFLKEGILNKIAVGKSYQCFLNFSSDKTLLFLSINEINAREEFIKKNRQFQLLMTQIMNSSETSYESSLIRSLIFHENILIIVTEDSATSDSIKNLSKLFSSLTYKIMTKKSFIEYYSITSSIQEKHIVLLNIDNYVKDVASVGQSLLMKGIFKNTIEENVKDNNRDMIFK